MKYGTRIPEVRVCLPFTYIAQAITLPPRFSGRKMRLPLLGEVVSYLITSSLFYSIRRDLFHLQNIMGRKCCCNSPVAIPCTNGFGQTVHRFGTGLACFSVFSLRCEDVIADPRSPDHLHCA